MSSRNEDRLNLGCLVGNLSATIVTRCGLVYQGTIDDWDCGRFTNSRPDSPSSDSDDSQKEESTGLRTGDCCGPRFIRMMIECIPGNICCPTYAFNAVVEGGASLVFPVFGVTGGGTLYPVDSSILINWDDVSSVGLTNGTACLTGTP